MLILDINKVSKDFGYGPIFEELSFSLNEGERISIIGPNGGGKSTLLKMIAQIEKCDSGTISIKKDARVAYLDQTSPDQKDDRIVEDILRDGFAELLKIENEINRVYEKMGTVSSPEDYNRMANRVSTLQQRFQDSGGYEIDTEINMVCSGLLIREEMRHQNYNSLSGGEKTLVHLAKGLLQKPDLFLLDEPTNHLDVKRIEWLENYIKTFKGSVVIVSHDRRFLDNVSSKLLEIDNGEATVYNTNYSGYLIEKERRYNQLMENWVEQ
ncbi:MAG: ATP-binding cassette domain-containing protein, partial [Acetatifactor sp.]|nr:ATP-binding cassette domain-containing protein [Acetatifactor sp.]